MKVLVLNCGSSTLKFQVYEIDKNISLARGRRLARGLIEKIAGQGTIKFEAKDDQRLQGEE